MRSTLWPSPVDEAQVGDNPWTGRAAVAIVCAALLALWFWSTIDISRVDLTVSNPTSCSVEVTAAPMTSGADMVLGTAPAGGAKVLHGLPDHDGSWHFRVTYAGTEVADQVVPRDVLAGAGWRWTIPGSVATQLADCAI
jgi:hypothetical protein